MDLRIDLDQWKQDQLVYKVSVVISRFMCLVAALLMIMVSISLGASAGMANCAPQPYYFVNGHHEHGIGASAECQESGCRDLDHRDKDCQDCCLGPSCVSSGALLQEAASVTKRLSTGQPGPSAADHLYGRPIAPETGPPKLIA
jgi:hypothetical protein